MNCLKISQHEEQHYKVRKGRNLHEIKEHRNVHYLRKKIGCVKKEISVYLASVQLRLRGIVDEVLHFSDGTASPLDYKYAEYHNYTFETYKTQSLIYGMLISERYNKPVNKGYICYIKQNHFLKEIEYTEKDKKNLYLIVDEIFDIIQKGYFPEATKRKARCTDCCYRNICIS